MTASIFRRACPRELRQVGRLVLSFNLHLRISTLVVLFGLLPSVPCSAQQTADRIALVPIRVELRGPRTCPDGPAFAAEILKRTGRARLALADEPAYTFVVDVTDTLGRSTGQLVVRHAGEQSDARQVRGATCNAVISALTLTAALSIDPHARLVVPEAPSEATRQPTPARPPPSEPAPPATPKNSSHRVRTGVGALSTWVLRPHILAGATTFLGYELQRDGLLSPDVRLSLSYASNAFHSAPTAAFGWLAATLEVCPMRLRLAPFLDVRPCAFGEGGVLSASGRQIELPERAKRSWWSLGAAGRVVFLPDSPIGLELFSRAAMPLVERTFVFESPREIVGRTPSVALSLGLTVFFALP